MYKKEWENELSNKKIARNQAERLELECQFQKKKIHSNREVKNTTLKYKKMNRSSQVGFEKAENDDEKKRVEGMNQVKIKRRSCASE